MTTQDTHTTQPRGRNVHSAYLALATILIVAPAWWLEDGSSRVATELDFTGQVEAYVVPADACRIRIEVVGAAGGHEGTSGAPGAGARATADFVVTPGETLRVRVGGWGGKAAGSTPGAGGWNGGGAGGDALDADGKAGSGGGGATDIRRGGDRLEHRIVVAAGGSGGAGGGIGGSLGTGGGNGGDPIGHQGFALLGAANPAGGGTGGTQTAGASLGLGADGGAGTRSGGGGGGGGLYGGDGGSGSSFSGGHGGGGSSSGPDGTVFRTGTDDGFGRATISYDPGSRC